MSAPKKRIIRLTNIDYDDGAAPKVHPKVRYCPECGTRVSKYKDAWDDHPYCYAHDHLKPWSTPYIMGSYHRKEKNQEIRRFTGRGRGNHKKGARWAKT